MATCIPVASGVPAQPGAPQWWNPAGSPRPYNDDLDDPRWRGATRRGYQNGAAEDGVFRALHMVESGVPFLYLSLQAFHDPTEGTNLDGIYVGFQRPGAPAFLINIQAYSSVATSFEAGTPGGIACLQQSGSAWNPVANPAWLNDTRSWLTLPSGGSTSYSWAVNMRVPAKSSGADFDNAGINLGNLTGGATFKFFYAIVKDIGPAVIAYYLPRTVDIDIDPGTLDNVYPDPSTWDNASIGTGGAGCGVGISLNSWDVGTTNTDPVSGFPAPNQIHVSATSPTTNHLFAKPLNATGGDVTPHSLEATFRTANWGSQADFSFAPGATPWEEILPGTTKDNGAATTPNGSQASIEFNWTISAAEAAQWIPPGGTKWTHQCMLVTLQGPYDFINDSVYRNMDFVQASEFEELAEVSVEGLAPIGSQNREVYLYVEKNNMPYVAEGEPGPDLKSVMSQLAERNDLGAASFTTHRVEPVVPTFDLIAHYVPTIRFHVFHETPKRINLNGKVKSVVEEQTAFGHFVHHDGAVYGWDHALGGEFKKIQENLYRLEVEDGWKKVIRIRVRAWDEKPPDDRGPEILPPPPQPKRPNGCLAWLLGLIASIVAAFKKKPQP